MNRTLYTLSTSARQSGLSIIELMVAMVLGLLIMGVVAGVMLSNNQGFRTTQALTQMQDSVRVGFELLARDIRHAGNMPCGTDIPVVNILTSAQGGNTPWQYDWDVGIKGLTTSDTLAGVNNHVAGTEALILMSADAGNVYMNSTLSNSANFTVGYSGSSHGLRNGDILMVCNSTLATIFQMSSGDKNKSNTIVVNSGNGSPGNCTKGLGEIEQGNNASQPCAIPGNPGPYGVNSVIAKLNSVAWYIGDNKRATEGGRSLYMARLDTAAEGNAQLSTVEIASGIADMQLRYRSKDTSNFVAAGFVTNWADVNAVEVTLTMHSQDKNVSIDAAANDGRLSRALTSIVAIRNRSL